MDYEDPFDEMERIREQVDQMRADTRKALDEVEKLRQFAGKTLALARAYRLENATLRRRLESVSGASSN